MSFTRNLFSRKYFLVNLVLVGIMMGFGAAFALLSGGRDVPKAAMAMAETPPQAAVSRDSALGVAEALQAAFNDVATTVLPSVVELDVVGTVAESTENQSPWRFFFGNPEEAPEEKPAPREYSQEGLGSGIIVRVDGAKVFVLTNFHVVEGADDITVKLFDEREYEASVVGTDERRDLAVVSFETTDAGIRAARLGNSDTVKVGDWAIAIGSPFGLFSSVTAGIVSAIGRDDGPDGNINDFIQTDASINRGNSGGALVNIRGEVIGINTWIASDTGGSIGLGFSIPINNASRVIDDLIARGSVRYGWLGVLLSDSNKATIAELGAGDQKGALIAHVFTEGPAAAGGILPGDFVVSVDGKAVANLEQLVRIVGDLPPGRTSVFTVVRSGKRMDVRVTIAERNENAVAEYAKLWPGLEVASLTAEAASAVGAPKGTKGVLVASVIGRSPASTLGLKQGDVVTAVNDKAVATVADFYRLLNDPAASKVQFTVLRDGQSLTTLALVRK